MILLTRDIFADAASVAADAAKSAADNARPSEKERKEGVDFEAAQKKGKQTAKGVSTGKLQAEARESLWDGADQVKEYLDEKLPEGEEARERLIAKLQQVSDFDGVVLTSGRHASTKEPRVQARAQLDYWPFQEVRTQGAGCPGRDEEEVGRLGRGRKGAAGWTRSARVRREDFE